MNAGQGWRTVIGGAATARVGWLLRVGLWGLALGAVGAVLGAASRWRFRVALQGYANCADIDGARLWAGLGCVCILAHFGFERIMVFATFERLDLLYCNF